jgi:diaminohydroxyphosphoribosylaminopyrimidine deaminase/5-amino-6-(5-phosphoribosylamino)uracil reductase
MTPEHFMMRAIGIAELGHGKVAPNPLVGAVLVKDNRIIGEGYHQKFGEPHAEVNAIDAANGADLSDATLYVTLEPCSHHGKTPPCAELIIRHGIGKVVVGTKDPFPLVSGNGIARLRAAGVQVEVGLLGPECAHLNRRFLTYHARQRPYIILKWAQTSDGFIAAHRSTVGDEEYRKLRYITGYEVQKLVHRWRSEEDAVLVGRHTAVDDDPALNVRHWEGRNPVRVTIDQHNHLPQHLKLFDGSQQTLVFTARPGVNPNVSYVICDFDELIIPQVLSQLHSMGILSLFVEGGTRTITNFISEGIWDEARVFTAPSVMRTGIAAPLMHGEPASTTTVGDDSLSLYLNS